MTLGFKQQFPWKEPTNFREKILAGFGMIRWELNGKWYITDLNRYNAEQKYNGEESNLQPDFKPKLHTLRADPYDRWKAGRKIEMVYRGAGYKILDHFNKNIPELEKCVSVQKIRISGIVPAPDHGKGIYTDPEAYFPLIEIDGKSINYTYKNGSYEYCKELTLKLANNDGFASITELCKWFGYKTDKNERRITPVFKGKIIHWTDLRY